MTDDLLTLEDIAGLHRCSVRRARDVIVKLPGFPAVAATSTPRRRVWLRKEVVAYMKTRKPAQIPHNGRKTA